MYESLTELKKELNRVNKILNGDHVPFSPAKWGANRGHQEVTFKKYKQWLEQKIEDRLNGRHNT